MGHSGHTDEKTFVPLGKAVCTYGREGSVLPVRTAMKILSGPEISPTGTAGAGKPIPNYRISPLDSYERAHQVSYSPSDCERTLRVIESATALCTAPNTCTPLTGHTCNGVFGELGTHDVVHLLMCRGEDAAEPDHDDEEWRRDIRGFLRLDAPRRVARWAELTDQERDRLLAANQVSAWLSVCCVRDYAASRTSNYAIARYMGVLDVESKDLIMKFAKSGDGWNADPDCAALVQDWEAELTGARNLLRSMLAPGGNETWKSLTQDSCADLAAVQAPYSPSRSIGETTGWWLNTIGKEEAWRHALGTAKWVQDGQEPVVKFLDGYYAVDADPDEAPVWPDCQSQRWCWLDHTDGTRTLVRLGGEHTGELKRTSDGAGFVRLGSEDVEREIDDFLALDREDRAVTWRELWDRSPAKGAEFRAHARVAPWLIAQRVFEYVDQRESIFAEAAFIDALDAESKELLASAAGSDADPDPVCLALWDAYTRQMQMVDEMIGAVESGEASADGAAEWLTGQTLEDLLAIRSEGRAGRMEPWLASLRLLASPPAALPGRVPVDARTTDDDPASGDDRSGDEADAEEAFWSDVDRFLELDHESRVARWNELLNQAPHECDRLLAASRVVAFFYACSVYAYAESRGSALSIARYLGTLDEEFTGYIADGWQDGDESCEVWGRYLEQLDWVDGFIDATRTGGAETLWAELDQDTQEDLLCIQAGGRGDSVRVWLARADE
ncbi:putative adhesin [Streptomyces roseus]|uniref:putative adhesin n=1 Tax=Streptomyces roseus TaxID=66430 RepID=UPI00340FC21B